MDINGITTISVTNLQSRLAQTLRWSSQARRAFKLTHWFVPTHVIIPIFCLPKEVRELLSRLPEERVEGAREKDGEVAADLNSLTAGCTCGGTIKTEEKSC